MLQFTLNGRLAADPTFHTYGADAADMARLRVASTNPGSQNTDFFDVAVFGPAVDDIRQAHKGDTVKLTGVGQQNVWQTDDGDRRENISLVTRKILDHTPATRTATATAEHDATTTHRAAPASPGR